MPVSALIVVLATLTSPVDDSATKCPVSGKPAKPEVSLFSEGKTLNFCCADCRRIFAARFENRVSSKEKKAKWRLGFNGKDLAGFRKPTRTGKWEVRAGVLTGFGGPGVLATKESWDHFELSADFRVQDTGERRGNSGIFIRSTGLTVFRGRWPDGPEIQVDHGDPSFWTGAIWKTARAKKVRTKDKEWFRMRVEARGRKIRVWVNEQLVTEHEQEGDVVKGPIAFQVHHPTDLVEIKNLKIRTLTAKVKAKAKAKG